MAQSSDAALNDGVTSPDASLDAASRDAVRVRFAPSPTGHLHIGSLRTALFNWLFARHYGGTFLIRIEDTDLERSLPEYTKSLLDGLAWGKIESDEPLVIQSERKPRHIEVAQELLKKGRAYKCFCTPEELRERHGENAALGEGYAFYDQKCRNMPLTVDDTRPYAIRFKVPTELDEIVFNDLVRGPVIFKRGQFDDFIIVRSDGSPMYNFVVVVDDADMGITHVIRGEDHIPNTPKQVMLYSACGFRLPAFAHLSLILGPDGNKLSKRDAATSVIDYKKNGFLPAALCNYLVRLGWSHGDQEIFAREELIRFFSLDHVGKKGAIWDMHKLEWMNSVYIKALAGSELERIIVSDVDEAFRDVLKHVSQEKVHKAIDLYKDRVKTLRECAELVRSLFVDVPSSELNAIKSFPESGKVYLSECLTALESEKVLDKSASEALIKRVCAQFGIKLPEIAQPLRIALTGKLSAPGVYDLMDVLGRDIVIERIRKALGVWDERTGS